ncbi:MAG: PAS domain-containing protein [Sterolibacterium sp.]
MMPVPRQQINISACESTPSLLAEDETAALLLDKRGMIRGCNNATEELFGYRRSEVFWQHVSMLLPQLADIELIQDGRINPRLRFLSRIGGYFQALTRRGEYFASDLFLLDLSNPDSSDLRVIVRRYQH